MITNLAGVYNARYGKAYGHTFLFTHRDPKTGEYWAESDSNHPSFKGAWISGDRVTFQ